MDICVLITSSDHVGVTSSERDEQIREETGPETGQHPHAQLTHISCLVTVWWILHIERQRHRSIISYTVYEEALSPASSHEPVSRGQGHDHQNDHNQTTDEGNHL